MKRKLIKFNMNQIVRVKLTDHGRKIHREQFRELNAKLPLTATIKYTPPIEDDHGWSRWQLWDLFQRFGTYFGMCKTPPFEMEIELYPDT